MTICPHELSTGPRCGLVVDHVPARHKADSGETWYDASVCSVCNGNSTLGGYLATKIPCYACGRTGRQPGEHALITETSDEHQPYRKGSGLQANPTASPESVKPLYEKRYHYTF